MGDTEERDGKDRWERQTEETDGRETGKRDGETNRRE